MRKKEITVETYEVLLIKQRSLSRGFCESCGKQVAVISIDDACTTGMSAEAIRRHGETGRIHLIRAAGGSPQICLNSWFKFE